MAQHLLQAPYVNSVPPAKSLVTAFGYNNIYCLEVPFYVF